PQQGSHEQEREPRRCAELEPRLGEHETKVDTTPACGPEHDPSSRVLKWPLAPCLDLVETCPARWIRRKQWWLRPQRIDGTRDRSRALHSCAIKAERRHSSCPEAGHAKPDTRNHRNQVDALERDSLHIQHRGNGLAWM